MEKAAVKHMGHLKWWETDMTLMTWEAQTPRATGVTFFEKFAPGLSFTPWSPPVTGQVLPGCQTPLFLLYENRLSHCRIGKGSCTFLYLTSDGRISALPGQQGSVV